MFNSSIWSNGDPYYVHIICFNLYWKLFESLESILMFFESYMSKWETKEFMHSVTSTILIQAWVLGLIHSSYSLWLLWSILGLMKCNLGLVCHNNIKRLLWSCNNLMMILGDWIGGIEIKWCNSSKGELWYCNLRIKANTFTLEHLSPLYEYFGLWFPYVQIVFSLLNGYIYDLGTSFIELIKDIFWKYHIVAG